MSEIWTVGASDLKWISGTTLRISSPLTCREAIRKESLKS